MGKRGKAKRKAAELSAFEDFCRGMMPVGTPWGDLQRSIAKLLFKSLRRRR